MKKDNLLSVTLPREWINKIEESRGDISRSRYVLRLIEKGYNTVAVGGSSSKK